MSGKDNPMFGRSGALSPVFGKPQSEEAKRKFAETIRLRQEEKRKAEWGKRRHI